jgi:hypothetical protein
VGAWLDEALTSLTTCNPTDMPTLEDLAALGWETVARIVWIRHDAVTASRTVRFRRDAIHCVNCSWSSTPSRNLIYYSYGCGHVGDAELTVTFDSGSASPPELPLSVTGNLSVELKQIQCLICRAKPFYSIDINCISCSFAYHHSNNPTARVTQYYKPEMKTNQTMIEKMFGEEIKDYEQSLPQLRTSSTNHFDTSRGPGKHVIT